MGKILFTSESVTEGHPDKICDQISDAILDAMLAQDPMSRVACETAVTTDLVLVMGEITSNATVDIEAIVRDTICKIGYDDAAKGFDGKTCQVKIALDKQSSDIAMGVDKALEAKLTDSEIESEGAGDQGMMFGYATNETDDDYMPYPIYLAHKLSRQLSKVRKDGTLSYLRPDGKSQVTVEYDENGNPLRLDAVVVSSQHSEDVSWEQIQKDIRKYVVDAVLPAELIDKDTDSLRRVLSPSYSSIYSRGLRFSRVSTHKSPTMLPKSSFFRISLISGIYFSLKIYVQKKITDQVHCFVLFWR